jgi:hypothetical protein
MTTCHLMAYQCSDPDTRKKCAKTCGDCPDSPPCDNNIDSLVYAITRDIGPSSPNNIAIQNLVALMQEDRIRSCDDLTSWYVENREDFAVIVCPVITHALISQATKPRHAVRA